MPFAACCPFCHVVLNDVPVEHEGSSIPCPRCQNSFTLAAMLTPPKRGRRLAGSRKSISGLAVKGNSVGTVTVPAPLLAAVTTPWEPEVETSASPAEGPKINRCGVASFFLGTMALLCASISGVSVLVVPLAGIALLFAVLGILAHAVRKSGLTLAAAGMAVSMPVLAIACWWPTVLNLPAESTAKTPSAVTQNVYHHKRTTSLARVAPRQSEWVDASQDAVQQAGVRVRVAKAAVKPVALTDTSGRRRTAERSLVIQLRISNAGADRLVEYQSWSATAGALPSLKDSLGRSYRLRDYGPDWIVVGQIRHAWLPTAKWVDDVLVFEAPSDRIDSLRLELPCAGVGLEGRFQLEIPGRWISLK